ncbi:hypothetical protein D3C80_1643260 [compost metagenome]
MRTVTCAGISLPERAQHFGVIGRSRQRFLQFGNGGTAAALVDLRQPAHPRQIGRVGQQRLLPGQLLPGADRLIACLKYPEKTVQSRHALRADRHGFHFLQPQIGGIPATGRVRGHFLK